MPVVDLNQSFMGFSSWWGTIDGVSQGLGCSKHSYDIFGIYLPQHQERLSDEYSNRASQAAVLPARGCGARKCIKTSGPLGGLNIHQHLGGQVKQIYTPDLYVRLRHGGTIDLSVCREDKVEILRAVTRSLNIDPQLKNQLLQLCDLASTNSVL